VLLLDEALDVGDASMGIRAGDEAVDSEKRRCLRAVVCEEKGSAPNGALGESKAVSSHRTKKPSPLDSLPATSHSLSKIQNPFALAEA
jgi:hypothetical protein